MREAFVNREKDIGRSCEKENWSVGHYGELRPHSERSERLKTRGGRPSLPSMISKTFLRLTETAEQNCLDEKNNQLQLYS